jgi:hypothetical protein
MLVGTKLEQMQNLQKFKSKTHSVINSFGEICCDTTGNFLLSDRPLMSFHLLLEFNRVELHVHLDLFFNLPIPIVTMLEDSFIMQIWINYIIMSTALGSIISEAILVSKLNIIFQVYSTLLCFSTSLLASRS